MNCTYCKFILTRETAEQACTRIAEENRQYLAEWRSAAAHKPDDSAYTAPDPYGPALQRQQQRPETREAFEQRWKQARLDEFSAEWARTFDGRQH